MARDLLATYIQVFPIDARARCVDRLGWHDNVFVTAQDVIGKTNEAIVFQNPNSIEPTLSTAGSVETWRESIARLAEGNSRLVFSISTAHSNLLSK